MGISVGLQRLGFVLGDFCDRVQRCQFCGFVIEGVMPVHAGSTGVVLTRLFCVDRA